MSDRLARLAAMHEGANSEVAGEVFMGNTAEVLGMVDEEQKRRARRNMFLQDVYLDAIPAAPAPASPPAAPPARSAAEELAEEERAAKAAADATAVTKLERANKLKEMEIDMLKMELDAERNRPMPALTPPSPASTPGGKDDEMETSLFSDDGPPSPGPTTSGAGGGDPAFEAESPAASPAAQEPKRNLENATGANLVAGANLDLLNVFLRASLKHKLGQNLTDEQLEMLEEMTEEEYGDGDPYCTAMPKMLQLLVTLLGAAVVESINRKEMVAPAMQPQLAALNINDPQAAAIVFVAEYLYTRTKEIAGFQVLHISVPRTEFRKDESGSPYTKYEIEITTPEGRRKWTVDKRYSDFANLLSSMKDSVAESIALKLPHLPPKLFGKARLQDDVVEARRIDLQKFLTRLSLNREAMEVELARTVWHDFLKTPPDLRHAGAAKQDNTKPRALLSADAVARQLAPPQRGEAGGKYIFRALQIVDSTTEREVLCCVMHGLAIIEAAGDDDEGQCDPNGMSSQKVWGYYPSEAIESVESSTCNGGKTKTCEIKLVLAKKPMRFCLTEPEPLVSLLAPLAGKPATEVPEFVDRFWKRCIHTDRGLVRWQPDKETKQCTACQTQFKKLSKSNRRHHCRHCGYIFCNACTHNALVLTEMGYDDEQRICTHCYQLLLAHRAFKANGLFTLTRADQLDQGAV